MLFGSRLETYLIVGLGNPGAEYAHTRHNCGFEVLDILADRMQATLSRNRCKALLAEVRRGDQRIVLAKPQTFMNASGECVAELLSWYKPAHDHLLVLYDDIDLKAGQLRMRGSGSAGTHNGMRSILAQLPAGDFPRLRIGIGAPPEGYDLVHFVLGHFGTPEEAQHMRAAFERAAAITTDYLDHGLEYAMQHCNRKNPEV